MPIHKRLFIILSTVVFSLSSAGGNDAAADTVAAEKEKNSYLRDKDKQVRCDTKEKDLREQLKKFKTGCQLAGSITEKKIEQYNEQFEDENEDLKVKLDSQEIENNGSRNRSNPQKPKSISCEERVKICDEAESVTPEELKANAESGTDPQNPMAKKIYEQLKSQYGIDLPDDEPKKGFFSRLCPMNSDDYEKDYDKTESKIESLENDLKREQKEFPELQKKNAQTLKELNDKVTVAKDNYEKGQKESSNNKKSAEDTLFKKTLEIADQRNKSHTSIVANQLQQANILDEIAKLNNLFSAANVQKQCDPEYKKIAEKYSPSTSQAPLIRGNLGSISKSSNSQAINIAKQNKVKRMEAEQCYSQKRIEKQSQLNALIARQQMIEQELVNTQTQAENSEKDFRRLQNDTAQFKRQAETDGNQLKLKYIKELENLQKEIAQEQLYIKQVEEKAQASIKEISQKLDSLRKKLNALGPKPKKSKNDVESFGDARDAHEEAKVIFSSYCNECSGENSLGGTKGGTKQLGTCPSANPTPAAAPGVVTPAGTK